MKGPSSSAATAFSERSCVTIAAAFGGLITGIFLASAMNDWPAHLLSLSSISSLVGTTAATTSSAEIQRKAIVHYATSREVPQQSLGEITVSLNVLRSLSPCSFLVFGLGRDSLMWAALNPSGPTLFLEEDKEWVKTVLKEAPFLSAKTVPYRTRLSEADALLKDYKKEPSCEPSRAFLKGNKGCRLALESLPEEAYEREWDAIMIDAPRGYFPEAPGRMAAIYSAAVMARRRTRPGVTHVFVHDVDRKVEREFAREFLCIKYKVGGVGRLWHFEIPPARDGGSSRFC